MTQNFKSNPHGGDPESVARGLGMRQVPNVRMDFSVNINPMGTPSFVRNILFCGIDKVSQYPHITAQPAISALARAHAVPEGSIIVGNGSTEIFSWIVQALKPKRPGWVMPCYGGYAEICAAAEITGSSIHTTDPRSGFSVSFDEVAKTDADMIFLASPNNPTGVTLDPAAVLNLAASNPDRWIILDESFIDFLPNACNRTLVCTFIPENLVVVKSLTKVFAIPGLRLGMACANPRTIQRIAKVRLAWSVNVLAQSVAEALYRDKEYLDKSCKMVTTLREEFSCQLAQLPGFSVYPSEANFILVRLPSEWPAAGLQAYLLKYGILIRSCQNFPGLGGNYCRLAVRPLEEIRMFMDVIHALMLKVDRRKEKNHEEFIYKYHDKISP